MIFHEILNNLATVRNNPFEKHKFVLDRRRATLNENNVN